jgi:hypothetical protein
MALPQKKEEKGSKRSFPRWMDSMVLQLQPKKQNALKQKTIEHNSRIFITSKIDIKIRRKGE